MSHLALLGGSPVTDDLIGNSRLVGRPEIERQRLMETYDSGVWDDWDGVDSAASRFCAEFAEFSNSQFCALVTNGTHTLQLALEALEIGVGHEVIVPGLTWQATASAVCDVNAVPVIVDVDPETLTIDPARVEEAVTERTRAIVPVHLYHRMADLEALMEIARRHGLAVIEDCAHTHGSRWMDRGAGTVGAFGSFSFQRSKLMNAGEGGALLTQDPDLFDRIVSLRSCGREIRGARVHSGNFRMTAFQAAILSGQLEALRVNADTIDRNGRILDAAVTAAPGVRPLRRHDAVTRQCSYGFVFLYDSEAFDGLEAPAFRKALKAELGLGFGTCYEPLNNSDVYYPDQKQRHALSESYVAQIRPGRWELPVARDLWANQIVLTHWPIFGIAEGRAYLLTEAIEKIHRHRHELIGVAT